MEREKDLMLKWRQLISAIPDGILRSCLPSTPEKIRYDPERRVLYLELDSQFKRDYVLRKLPKLRETAEKIFGPIEVRVGELPLLEELRRVEARPEAGADILVIGLGSGGVNAVERMWAAEVRGIRLAAMDTDSQALSMVKLPDKVLLGAQVTGGRSAGGDPERGKQAAEDSLFEIEQIMGSAHLVFLACGLGGGTGTGAAPVVAKLARTKGALTVGVVTLPFSFEGPVRAQRAQSGLERLKSEADVLIVIRNDRLLELSPGVPITKAFELVDAVLVRGVRGISDLITIPGLVNLDFADVAAVLRGAGTAVMGMGEAQGEGRAIKAAKAAATNPLLETGSIQGARRILLNVSGGDDLTLSEVTQVAEFIRKSASPEADLVFGAAIRPELTGKVAVTVIATDFRAPAAEETETPKVVRPVLPRRSPDENYDLPAFLRRPKEES
ncbi:MAG: cell division protein FtsZ [Candidatus Bipolaricaulota bacterium]|nr:cell division protein FtsZ [Candidatus Bipolaricaulota bacterium]MDW8126383.1 cell division protein FtsZ [Candidatus Bipolaricaulota bacterium]